MAKLSFFWQLFLALAAVSFLVNPTRLGAQEESDFICLTPEPEEDPTPGGLAGNARFWPQQSVLRILFLDGDPVVQQRVMEYPKIWSRFTDIEFQRVEKGPAEIRISFAGKGSWSTVGTAAVDYPASKPTMNYGWLKPDSSDEVYRSVVLHEFGHALGFIHEHESPAVDIQWNEEEVIKYYSGPPNYWDIDKIKSNLFHKESCSNYSEFDPLSIMIYPIPNHFTIDDFEVKRSTTLSLQDRRYSSKTYRPFHSSEVFTIQRVGADEFAGWYLAANPQADAASGLSENVISSRELTNSGRWLKVKTEKGDILQNLDEDRFNGWFLSVTGKGDNRRLALASDRHKAVEWEIKEVGGAVRIAPLGADLSQKSFLGVSSGVKNEQIDNTGWASVGLSNELFQVWKLSRVAIDAH